MRALRPLCLLLALLCFAPTLGALAPAGLAGGALPGLPQDLNNVPTVNPPTVTVVAMQGEYWQDTEGPRTHDIVVPTSPTGAWDRIELVYHQYPKKVVNQQDPWDRLCSASVASVEVLRCTTPRTDMTLTKDITEYASLLPQGATVPITADTGTYDQSQYYSGGQYVDVSLEFFANEPTKTAVPSPAAAVVPAWDYVVTCAVPGAAVERGVAFPAKAPSSAIVEVTLSGHGNEEDWFLNDVPPPSFTVYVDGQPLAVVQPMPYTYAFAGSYGADYSLHPLLWWTAQKETNAAGVYTGVGEIPPYRATLLPSQAALLTGTHAVSLVGANGDCYWPSSVSFLLR